jgi:hypothetical protein
MDSERDAPQMAWSLCLALVVAIFTRFRAFPNYPQASPLYSKEKSPDHAFGDTGLWVRDRWPLINSKQNSAVETLGCTRRCSIIQRQDDLPFAPAAFQFHAAGHEPRQ